MPKFVELNVYVLLITHLFCSSLWANLIVLYGPCDEYLFDVLHEIHSTLSNHVSLLALPGEKNANRLARRSNIPHVRHDLNNACSWVSHSTIAVFMVSETNATGQDFMKSVEQYNVPYLTTSKVCSCKNVSTPLPSVSSSSSLSYVLENAVFAFLEQEYLHDVLLLHENGSTDGLHLSMLLNSVNIRVSHLDITDDTDTLSKVEKYFDPWNLTSLSDAGRRLVALNIGQATDAFLKKLVESTVQNVRTKLLVVDSSKKWKKRLARVTAYEVDLVVVSNERVALDSCPVAVEVLQHEVHPKKSANECVPLSFERNAKGQRILLDIQTNLDRCCIGTKYSEYIMWKSFPWEEGVQNLKPVGIWSPYLGLMSTQVMDYTTFVYRIVVLEYPPYVVINKTQKEDIVLEECVLMEILQHLVEKLNFKYKLVTPAQKLFGHRLLNGKWTGAIGMVLSGRADAIPFLTVTPRRSKVVDFSAAVTTVYYGMLVATPKEPPRTFIFLRPYTKEVWLISIMAAFAMSIVLYQIHVLSQKIRGEYKGKKGLAKYSNCLWCIFSSMVQQGGIYLPEAISARLLLSTWWLAILVIVSTYSANLIAFLAFPESKWIVQTLKDLVDHQTVMLMIDEGCPVLEDFMKSETEIAQKIREIYLNNPKRGLLVKASDIEVVEIVSKGHAVFIDDVKFLTRLVDEDYRKTGRCRVTIAPDRFSRMVTGMALRRGSYLMSILDREITQMWEGGVLHHWKSKYSTHRDECLAVKTTSQGRYDEVDLDDVQGAFRLLFLGIATSIAIFAFEIIRRRLWYFRRHYYKPLNE